MKSLHNLGRVALSVVCGLALLALAESLGSAAQDKTKDKDKGKEEGKGKEKETKGLAKPFDQATVDSSHLEKQFKILKVDGKVNEQNLYNLRFSLVAKQKLAPEMLSELVAKTEVRFYAGEIIVGRYALQVTNSEQISRGLVQDEKMVLQLQLGNDQVERLREEKITKIALVKVD